MMSWTTRLSIFAVLAWEALPFNGATPRFDPHPSTYVCCLQNYSQDVRLTATLTNKSMLFLFFYLPSDNYTHKLVDYVNEMANALFLTVTP